MLAPDAGSLRFKNARTVVKVANILWSQVCAVARPGRPARRGALHARAPQDSVYTQDLPSRYLWMTDVSVTGQQARAAHPRLAALSSPQSRRPARACAQLYRLLQEASKGALKTLHFFPNEPTARIMRHGSLAIGAVKEERTVRTPPSARPTDHPFARLGS
jgi:hypothetical protein